MSVRRTFGRVHRAVVVPLVFGSVMSVLVVLAQPVQWVLFGVVAAVGLVVGGWLCLG